jgi:dTMP kinase
VSARRVARRARLVALEGIDGAGKSTLAHALTRALRRRGLSVALRHEPSDPRLGALAQSVSRGDPWTGAVYFTVDRYIARPSLEKALSRHDVVITDRSFYSTLAYQGSALPPRERQRLAELERTATREPDRIVLLEIRPHAALERLGGRARRRGPLEEPRTLDRVARAYRALARGPRWLVLDAEAPVPELVRAAVAHIGAPRRRGGRAFRRGRRR